VDIPNNVKLPRKASLRSIVVPEISHQYEEKAAYHHY